MKYLLFALLLLANGVYWVWCKLTGKPFEEFGGPQ